MTIVSNSEEETYNAGRKLGSVLESGSIVALNGKLGSGKTCLVKGIADALGIEENVTSPTYTIINEYSKDGSLLLCHIDLYRLENEEDFLEIGGKDILNADIITVIEWSERIKNLLPSNTIFITFKITGNTSRLINITGLEKI